MATKADELIAERDRLMTEVGDLMKRHGEDPAGWSDGVRMRNDNLARAVQRVEGEIDDLARRAERVEAVRSAAARGASMESGFGASGAAKRTRSPWEGLERSGNLSELDTPTGLRSRALDAVSVVGDLSERARETLTAMVEEDRGTASSRYVLALGNPAYRAAFEYYLRDPATAGLSMTAEETAAWREMTAFRAALSESNASALIPLTLDPAVKFTNNGATNLRSIATIKTTVTNQLRTVVSAGATAEWKAEGAQAADASPTLSAADITVYQGFESITGSYELLDDTDLASQIGALAVEARTRLEADAFAIGSGSGAPFGAITRLTAVTASRVSPTTGGVFTTASVADVYRVRDNTPARARTSGRAAWVGNIAILSVIQQMSPTAAGGSFWADLSSGIPPQLLGYPVYEATAMASAVTTGSSVLGLIDWSKYVIADRLGTTIQVNNVYGANGRSTGQTEFAVRWRTGGDLIDTAAGGRVLRL